MEELAIGTALACFAAVCIGIAPERAQPVGSPFEFYRAVNRVCAQVGKDSDAQIQRYWPDPKGDTATEMRSLVHFIAVKVEDARKVLKAATGVRAMPDAASAREEFLAVSRRVVEAGQRFQEEGYRWSVSMGLTDEALTELGKLARRHNADQCDKLF